MSIHIVFRKVNLIGPNSFQPLATKQESDEKLPTGDTVESRQSIIVNCKLRIIVSGPCVKVFNYLLPVLSYVDLLKRSASVVHIGITLTITCVEIRNVKRKLGITN